MTRDHGGERHASLQSIGGKLRQLWAAVALVATNDAAEDIAKEIRARVAPEKRQAALRFSRWARSADGREVLSLAGIDPSRRATDKLERKVAAMAEDRVAGGFGRIITHVGGRK